MNSHFRIKLSLTMIFFALVIAFTIATTDHIEFREQMMSNHHYQVEQIEDIVMYSLRNIEKAYFIFDQETERKMEENTAYLLALYAQSPDIDEWDFQYLSTLLGMDLYIIDEEFVITHSNVQEDIGLDFKLCCQKLTHSLIETRESGEILESGLDLEQYTGQIKKFIYIPTADKKYIIELGYSLQGGDIFQEFNFFKTMQELRDKYPSVNEINLINIEGLKFGEPVHSDNQLVPELRTAFEVALASQETTEVEYPWQSEKAIFRYAPYASEYDLATSRHKVVEIVYNDRDLQARLREHKQIFMWRLFLVLNITILLSFLISRWMAKPMYLAFHDSLTGLKNRAAFDEIWKGTLAKNKGKTIALLLIDLDDFKLVNDYFGHDMGDHLLKCAAENIHSLARKEDITFRWGGDEFAMILPATSRGEVEQVAKELISTIAQLCTRKLEIEKVQVTVSIGIALAPEHGTDPDILYKKADSALYMSKEKGKNQYHFYIKSTK